MSAVVIVEGPNAQANVERSHLVIRDGWPAEGKSRELRFSRGRCDVERIVFRAIGGYVSLAALDWCHQMGIPVAIVGADSRLMNTLIPPGPHDAPLKRAQAYAGFSNDGIRLAQELLRDKFQAQARAIEHDLRHIGVPLGGEAKAKHVAGEIRRAALTLSMDNELRALLVREGYVARLYWSVLLDTLLPWPEWTHSRVPAHWRRISSRELGATQQVRDATDPFNAVLNYAYTLLEVETRIAIHANGFDPDLGLLHVDTRARESLVCDLMESVRPFVDALCLAYCRRKGLRPHMFHELRNGVVRLDPDTARELTGWILPQLRRPAADTVAGFAARLRRLVVPYRLTIRSEAERRKAPQRGDFGNCGYCDTPLKRKGRKFCSRQCTLQRDIEVRKPIEIAQAKLAMLVAQGRDPRSRLGENKERSAKIAESNRRRAKYLTAEERRAASYEKTKRYRDKKRLLRNVDVEQA